LSCAIGDIQYMRPLYPCDHDVQRLSSLATEGGLPERKAILALSHADDHIAPLMALVDVTVRVGHLRERIASIDDGLETSRRREFSEQAHILGAPARGPGPENGTSARGDGLGRTLCPTLRWGSLLHL
jgi:hypothetical protein